MLLRDLQPLVERLGGMVNLDPVFAPSARCDGRPPLPLATRAIVHTR